MEVQQLLQWLEERYPIKPLKRELTPFEQGVLVGTNDVLEAIRSKVGILIEKEEVR